MLGERYTVKPGDNLWTISKLHLGAGSQWRRVWRYNNRKEVVQITGRGIANPDLIYPGQILLLPVLPGSARQGSTSAQTQAPTPSAKPPSNVVAPSAPPPIHSGQPLRTPQPTTPAPNRDNQPAGSLSRELPQVESPISIKYRLDDLVFPPIVQPGAIMEMRMTGDVLLMTKNVYPAVYVTQRREIEMQVVQQANQAFGTLVNDTRLIYDGASNKLTYRAMLVSQSKYPTLSTTAIGVQLDSNSPIPKLRFEFRIPKIEGSLPLFNYTALDVKVVVELTPKPEGPGGVSAQPLRDAQPATNWTKVVGTGLIVAGAVIVVGTLVEDFFTAGVGIADDPASFAAAGASVARGLQMLRGAAAALPRAAVPASPSLSVAIEPAFGAAGNVQR